MQLHKLRLETRFSFSYPRISWDLICPFLVWEELYFYAVREYVSDIVFSEFATDNQYSVKH